MSRRRIKRISVRRSPADRQRYADLKLAAIRESKEKAAAAAKLLRQAEIHAAKELANRVQIYRRLENKLLVVIAPADKDGIIKPVTFRHVAQAATNLLNDASASNGQKVVVTGEEVNLKQVLIQKFGLTEASINLPDATGRVSVVLGVYPSSTRALFSLLAHYPRQLKRAIQHAVTIT